MALTARVRRLHRFLGAVIGLQILLWTASGIYFVWTDIDEIRGDHLRAPVTSIAFDADWTSPGAIDFEGAALDRPSAVLGLRLIDLAGVPHYRLRFVDASGTERIALADARTGTIREPLNRDEAVALAKRSFAPAADVLDVARLTDGDVGAHHEYRGRPLPAWRVRFAHDSRTSVYVSANEGTVATHRNGRWRIFDALWMLHTMDYGSRDDFNNPWIRAVSLLALAVTVTGYLMWYRTRPKKRR